jgi:Ca-activated chloride channel family protein
MGETPLSTVGIGLDYDEALMAGLADAGTGGFHWVTREHDLAAVFAEELGEAAATVATGLKVDIPLPPGVSLVDAAGLPMEATATGATVRLGALRAEQERRLWLTLRVDSDLDAAEVALGGLSVGWSDLEGQSGVAVAAATPVTLTHDEAVFLAGVDEEVWGRSVVEDDYARLQTVLASAVQSGDQAGAQAAIKTYKDKISAMNATISSSAVVDNLAAVDSLEVEVNDQFEGDDQDHRQNVWSKSARSSSWSARRKGTP